jgi:hypothetical protein
MCFIFTFELQFPVHEFVIVKGLVHRHGAWCCDSLLAHCAGVQSHLEIGLRQFVSIGEVLL